MHSTPLPSQETNPSRCALRNARLARAGSSFARWTSRAWEKAAGRHAGREYADAALHQTGDHRQHVAVGDQMLAVAMASLALAQALATAKNAL